MPDLTSDQAGVAITFFQPSTMDGTSCVFICHASEDKEEFVEPLANALKKASLKVWYDRFQLKLGDSLRDKIDEGLTNSRYGVVVLSNSFLKKEWPKTELDALVSRQNEKGEKVILPIWHGIGIEEVRKFSRILASKLAAKSSDSLESIVIQIKNVLNNKSTPENLKRQETEPKDKGDLAESDRQEQCRRINKECYLAFMNLEHELLQLAKVILETWLEHSWDDSGKPFVHVPQEDMEKMADQITTRLLANAISAHKELDSISKLPTEAQTAAVAHVLHFDKKLFLSEEQLWGLHSHVRKFSSGAIVRLMLQIIPSQWILAMSRFAVNWTYDIVLDDRTDTILEYLLSQYKLADSIEQTHEFWERWKDTEMSLKELMFYERIGMLSPALFAFKKSHIRETYPFLYYAVFRAFQSRGIKGEQPLFR